jgi:hypothetical protein
MSLFCGGLVQLRSIPREYAGFVHLLHLRTCLMVNLLHLRTYGLLLSSLLYSLMNLGGGETWAADVGRRLAWVAPAPSSAKQKEAMMAATTMTLDEFLESA